MASNEAAKPAKQPPVDKDDSQAKLPPLSDHDFKIFNHMAETMDLFHNHFRQSWTLLWTACCNNKRPRSMTLKQFIDEGLRFADGLNTHHGIEERHIFPRLAARMPEFRGDLQAQHAQIHAGLDGFGDYLRGCRRGEHELELGALKERMESWGDILWTHLDEEVKTLGADNMRKYWSKEEMMRMPM